MHVKRTALLAVTAATVFGALLSTPAYGSQLIARNKI